MALKDRLGKCYMLAYQHVTEKQDWTLCHGFITDNIFGTGNTIDHAWCEHNATGKLYDPVLQKHYSKEMFIATFSPDTTVRYTKQEVLQHAFKFKHYGPWHEIDNSKIKFN